MTAWRKKWDTVIPADLKGLFVSGTYMSRWSRKGLKENVAGIQATTDWFDPLVNLAAD